MIDVTEVILNFQKLLVAIANSLAAIGLYKGSDEWEELAEGAFNILVVNHLTEKFDLSISNQYEMWDQDNKGLFVHLDAGEPILVGVKAGLSECRYRYDEIPRSENSIEFSFVEFGNPSFDEENIAGLEYAMGFDEDGRAICVRKENCKFFVNI